MLILRAVVAVLRIVVGGIRIAIRIVRVIAVIRIAVIRIVEEWPHLSVVVQVGKTSLAETTGVMQAPNAGAARTPEVTPTPESTAMATASSPTASSPGPSDTASQREAQDSAERER